MTHHDASSDLELHPAAPPSGHRATLPCRRRFPLHRWVPALLVGSLLVACAPASGTDAPGATPGPSRTVDDAGALAAAGEFVRQLDIARRTGDPDGLLALSAPSCDTCTELAESARNAKALDETVTGGALSVDSTPEITGRADATGAVSVTVPVTQEAGERLSGPGEPLDAWDSRNYRLHIELIASPTGWRVTATDAAWGSPRDVTGTGEGVPDEADAPVAPAPAPAPAPRPV